DDVIMVSHAIELLKAFCAASDAKWTTGPTEKSFLEAWWLRKFPDNPLKWGSVLSLADAEELLIEFRNSKQATWPKGVRKKGEQQKAAGKCEGAKYVADKRLQEVAWRGRLIAIDLVVP